MTGRVVFNHLGHCVTDLARSRRFYEELLGFELELIHYSEPSHRREPERRTLDEPGLTHISLSCDVEDACARVEQYGGEVLTETDIEVAVFTRDPDGQLIELLPLEYADRHEPS